MGDAIQLESACRRVLVRHSESGHRSTIFLGEHATYDELADQVRGALNLVDTANLVVRDSMNLDSTKGSDESKHLGTEHWIGCQKHWCIAWRHMLERSESKMRNRLMACLGVHSDCCVSRCPCYHR